MLTLSYSTKTFDKRIWETRGRKDSRSGLNKKEINTYLMGEIMKSIWDVVKEIHVTSKN